LITVPWVPQYRLRADCSRTARRFFAPGKLLRMDGRAQAEAGEKLASGQLALLSFGLVIAWLQVSCGSHS
jgi:hypothetical protein